MWVLPLTRRELVDLITRRRVGDVPGAVEVGYLSFDKVSKDAMFAVWPARPAEFGYLPTAIVLPEGSRRDSLAWLATYVRDFRPFTAYCQVIERSTAEQFLNGPTAPHLKGAEGICSGLILGEALAQASGRASILDLPANTYSATLSYAISRMFAITGGSVSLDAIGRLWTQARELTGQSGLGVPPNMILSVWAVALGMPGRSSQPRKLFDALNLLTMAWSELNTVGEIRDAIWQMLVDGYPGLEKMRGLLEMPREQRVQSIDVALRLLATARREGDERRSFLAGYFTSLLGPGTLDHTDMLAPVASVLPTAYLWYGLCASISVRNDALPVGHLLARRIVRDLTVPDLLIDRPRCDVALEELAMHGPTANLLKLNTKDERLVVDILPGVTMAVRWPPHDIPIEDDLRRFRDMEIQHVLLDMDGTMLKWRDLGERLRIALRIGDADRQPSNRRKRGNKP